MTTKNKTKFTVITSEKLETTKPIETTHSFNNGYQSNPIYEKLLNFRNLQEQQKKKFSVDDLFKLC